jgi:hypothetical protein
MATSGTTTFSVTRNDIIQSSLRLLGVLEEGTQPTASAIENASMVLNMMLKDWMTDGIKLWTVTELTIPLKANQTSYTIGPSSTYDVNTNKPLRLIQSFLRNVSNTTNQVAKVSLLSGGSGYTVQPTNPVSCTGGSGSGATFNLTYTGGVVTKALLDNSGGSNYAVGDVLTMSGGTFTTPATVTVDSLLNTYIDLPMSILSQQEYNILGSKYNTGTVNSVYYWPYATYGELKVFLTPNSSTSTMYELHVTVQRPIEDITTANQTFDFPSEWFQSLRWGLASEIAVDYGLPLEKLSGVIARAESYKQRLMAWDTEYASTFFQPDIRSQVLRFR